MYEKNAKRIEQPGQLVKGKSAKYGFECFLAELKLGGAFSD